MRRPEPCRWIDKILLQPQRSSLLLSPPPAVPQPASEGLTITGTSRATSSRPAKSFFQPHRPTVPRLLRGFSVPGLAQEPPVPAFAVPSPPAARAAPAVAEDLVADLFLPPLALPMPLNDLQAQAGAPLMAKLQLELMAVERGNRAVPSVAEVHAVLRLEGLLESGARLQDAIRGYLAKSASGTSPAALEVLAILDAQLLAGQGILLEDLQPTDLELFCRSPEILAEGETSKAAAALRERLYGASRFPIPLKDLASRWETPNSTLRRQLVIELVAQSTAVKEYLLLKSSMEEQQRGGMLGARQRIWMQWVDALAAEIAALRENPRNKMGLGRGSKAMQLVRLLTLDPEIMAAIASQVVLNLILAPNYRHKSDVAQWQGQVKYTAAVVAVGEAIELETHFRQDAVRYMSPISSNPEGKAARQEAEKRAIGLMRRKLERNVWDLATETVPIGGALVDLLLQSARVELHSSQLSPLELEEIEKAAPEGTPENERSPKGLVNILAFQHTRQREGKKTVGYILLQENVRKMLSLAEEDLAGFISPKHQPLVMPPRSWTPSGAKPEGPYLIHQVPFIRTTSQAITGLRTYTPERVASVMDFLGRTPWQINERMLRLMQEVKRADLALAGVPPIRDPEVPELPENLAEMDPKTRLAYLLPHQNAQKKCRELQSERPTFELKLKVAEDFLSAPRIFFPHNVDFRGRAYPLPPHLNHIGDDVSRALLKFAEPKPLGPVGLFWLKVDLANLMGKNKISFEERVGLVDSLKEKILQVADNPLAPENRDLWVNADDGPWQALARCFELAAIWRSPEAPEAHLTQLPVHLDGSCNGLQHYAALGRDQGGGEAVNLVDSDRPQDVYSVVLGIVKGKVEADAAKSPQAAPELQTEDNPEYSRQEKLPPRELALLLIQHNALQRKVVKQTVMTICYGVTAIGARAQVKGQLEDLMGDRVDPVVVSQLAGYLSKTILSSIDVVFERAMKIKKWFDGISKITGQLQVPTCWISPIGLACAQPYNKKRTIQVVTKRQKVTLADEDEREVNKVKQRMGFPPNFIHSLDATHMMMVAEGSMRRGIVFAGVHDSFWTHPSDAPVLNEIIREEFVKLHSQPILENFRQDMLVLLGGRPVPELPPQGTLDITKVLTSKYIFN